MEGSDATPLEESDAVRTHADAAGVALAAINEQARLFQSTAEHVLRVSAELNRVLT
ncbi:hypothetical protein K7711_13850 [Nocardia sp. CA2R105]|uniref:hypothetical protein n=1 Tax=Nocardia coffeae TaxID=2873381 RepID=UPI001CA62E97|nr:hypothetical protein [Nocardia coffeae]MBY8857568.1 hypothetical protein [Nocardia coffeae]